MESTVQGLLLIVIFPVPFMVKRELLRFLRLPNAFTTSHSLLFKCN